MVLLSWNKASAQPWLPGKAPCSLNWAFFNSDSALLDHGSVEMTEDGGNWEELSTELIAEQEGYVVLSLSSGSESFLIISRAEAITLGNVARLARMFDVDNVPGSGRFLMVP